MKKISSFYFIKVIYNLIYDVLFLHVFLKAHKDKILPLKSDFLIITVAFNNLNLIRIQRDYLRNLMDDFDYIVADNSNNSDESEKILSFCIQNSVSYVKVPKNLLSGLRMSGSHAMALNWCYKNIIKKYYPKYFGFLDHDIIPIRPTEIIPKIRNGLWGIIRTKKERWWYLWPGFSFFEFEKIKQYRLNFFPTHTGPSNSVFLDTGGSNYLSFYKNIRRSDVGEPENNLIDLTTGQTLTPGTDSSNTIEIIDNAWLHLRQVSWRRESVDKIARLSKIIDITNEILNR